ncbi:uncharacterized protein BDCG_16227 [Blastomyces dermatitidis ER-3]|uniref:Uncharacterized protein n=1 Tax=Ajellomyces dermatitidis (strain ER-3 / ATCC MYA-2586) TaxID=559297 RepID=A0ABX2VSP8_AJEDR|nr:uncharacterized protein BDCG_16227 [Blastomyces dermatitidis ER-3]OAS99612.1 hypothetical protein BDCG_16227 [Blastomyces dermatitidis ER-3]
MRIRSLTTIQTSNPRAKTSHYYFFLYGVIPLATNKLLNSTILNRNYLILASSSVPVYSINAKREKKKSKAKAPRFRSQNNHENSCPVRPMRLSPNSNHSNHRQPRPSEWLTVSLTAKAPAWNDSSIHSTEYGGVEHISPCTR